MLLAGLSSPLSGVNTSMNKHDGTQTALTIVALIAAVLLGGLKLIGCGTRHMVDGKILTGQENP